MNTEQQLTDRFHEWGRHGPEPIGPAEAALRGARTRRGRLAGVGIAGAVAVLAGSLALPGLGHRAAAPSVAASPSWTVPAGKAGAALGGGGAASCAYGYSPDVMAERTEFAFDGTVISIGPPRSDHRRSRPEEELVGVTLRVNQWFRGDTGESVVVDMPAPASATTGEDSLGSPEYGVGTRMLVSGTPRWGGGDPLAAAIAWWGCGGFTRYYSAEVAAEWADATK